MNRIKSFFKRIGTIYTLFLWGSILFLLIYMLLYFSKLPDLLVVIVPCLFIYVFIKKSRMIATVGGISAGIASVIFSYGIDGTVAKIQAFVNKEPEIVLGFLFFIVAIWYMIRSLEKRH